MPKKTLPDFVPPMMAESAKTPFDSPDWFFPALDAAAPTVLAEFQK